MRDQGRVVPVCVGGRSSSERDRSASPPARWLRKASSARVTLEGHPTPANLSPRSSETASLDLLSSWLAYDLTPES